MPIFILSTGVLFDGGFYLWVSFSIAYLDSRYIQNLSIFRTQGIEITENL